MIGIELSNMTLWKVRLLESTIPIDLDTSEGYGCKCLWNPLGSGILTYLFLLGREASS